MNIDFLNNKIIIIEDGTKNSLLSMINSDKKLVNVKIITLSELKQNYYFDYNKKTIYYICKKYNVIYDVAKLYLNNMYYIDENIDNENVQMLCNLYKELENNNLLIKNDIFKKYLCNKDIVLYNLKYVDQFYKNIFNKLSSTSNIIEINDDNNNGKKVLYKANTIEDEVSFVASKICELISSGIDINDIKLSNIQKDYVFIINKTFKMYNIPIILPNECTIKGTNIVKRFKELFSNNIDNTIKELKKFIISDEDNKIYKQIINVINQYCFASKYEDVKEFIFNDIDNIKKSSKMIKNAVKIIDFESEIISNEYVFLLNFNEGIVPVNHKDEDFFSDSIKKELKISDSIELNKNNILKIKNKIINIKNLILTYHTHNNGAEIYISNAYDKDIIDIIDVKNNYCYSNVYNKLRLVSLKDSYNKYGTLDEELMLLNSKYKEEKYLSFDNKYSMINVDNYKKYLDNKLTLSYSSINSYYECKYKYYLNYILKLNKYEDSYEITIGNIFHHILSKCFDDNFDFESSWEKEIKECKYSFNNMEKYFLSKLKESLILIIDTIKKQMEYTQLSKIMCEKQIIIDINKDLHIRFTGFVDKILYSEFDGQTILVIVDYKTGNPNLSINNIIYGLNMQLPIYIYLAKNMKDINNVRIGGFYLQKILNNVTDKNEFINGLKLQGYSNSDINVLEKVDSSYNDSKVIKSLKTKSDGFYYYSKMINDEGIEKLYNIVDNNIKNASNEIMNAFFDINPKEINNSLVGCSYCKYKDICYMSNKDIVKLPIPKSILGGEDNADMD